MINVIGLEVVSGRRSWPCRTLRHSTCRTAYPARKALAYGDDETGSDYLVVPGWLRCPCQCHGELPS